MPKILTSDNISPKGLGIFSSDEYEIGTSLEWPNAIIVRSSNIHDMELPESLWAIGRAGVGVNNIPVQKCLEKGIVVFNTPGANANAVKEMTIAGLLLASRDIVEGIIFAKSLRGQGAEVPKIVESNKKKFAGQEIFGKTLGVIGVGKIGVMVANSAIDLGMRVIGYDPSISVESAWNLSKDVERSDSLNTLVSESDYITLHLPLKDETRNMVNTEMFEHMKAGMRILNFSRGELVNTHDLGVAIKNGTVFRYVTDFPNDELINMENVITIPHLGASTQEAEDNCAIMVAKQLCDFIKNGNIKNSVNYPDCRLERNSDFRLVILNRNIAGIVGQISTILANAKVNICEMLNKSRGDYAYNIIDLSNYPTEGGVIKSIRRIEGVLKVRDLDGKKG